MHIFLMILLIAMAIIGLILGALVLLGSIVYLVILLVAGAGAMGMGMLEEFSYYF